MERRSFLKSIVAGLGSLVAAAGTLNIWPAPTHIDATGYIWWPAKVVEPEPLWLEATFKLTDKEIAELQVFTPEEVSNMTKKWAECFDRQLVEDPVFRDKLQKLIA